MFLTCSSFYVKGEIMRKNDEWKMRKIQNQEKQIATLEEEIKILKSHISKDGATDSDEVIDFKQKMKLWNELMEETNKLSDDYHALIDEMKEMRKISIKAIYGGGLRYKIVRLLMK